MAGKNKGGREVRKPKQAAKPKESKTGITSTEPERPKKLPRAK